MCPIEMCNKKMDMKRETERGCGRRAQGFCFIGESENIVLKES